MSARWRCGSVTKNKAGRYWVRRPVAASNQRRFVNRHTCSPICYENRRTCLSIFAIKIDIHAYQCDMKTDVHAYQVDMKIDVLVYQYMLIK